MLKLKCERGRPLTAEIWLLLAVMSSTCGFVLTCNRFFDSPWSLFVSVVSFNFYRLIFNIKSTMPILLDTGVTLIVQSTITFWGTKWGFAVSFFIVERTFSRYYFFPLLDEHMRVRKTNPEARPLKKIIRPLQPQHFALVMLEIYAINGFMLLVACFACRCEKLHCAIEAVAGLVLMCESMSFLACYKQVGCIERDTAVPQWPYQTV